MNWLSYGTLNYFSNETEPENGPKMSYILILNMK